MGDMVGEKSPVFGWRGKILKALILQKARCRRRNCRVTIWMTISAAPASMPGFCMTCCEMILTIDALDPENPLIFGCGPLVGTEFPCASRFTVTAKSPLTGIFGDTNAGGFFPVRLKQAGYDHIVIQGSSDDTCGDSH